MHNRKELPENPRVSLLVVALARMLERRTGPLPKMRRVKEPVLPLFEAQLAGSVGASPEGFTKSSSSSAEAVG